MVSALIYGKSEVEEDKITSSIFDSLLHLPDEMIWKIIKRSCYDYSVLPEAAGMLQNYEFWPRWDRENTENQNYVEPDLFLDFENISIIIEAKREYNKQRKEQLKKEIISYYNKYNKRVILFAIDGIENENNEKINISNDIIVEIVKTRWTKIFYVINNCINETNKLNYLNVNNIIRTLSLIKEYMIFNGYSEKKWFNEILEYKFTLNNLKECIFLLKMNSIDRERLKDYWFCSMIKKSFIINYSTIKYFKKWS